MSTPTVNLVYLEKSVKLIRIPKIAYNFFELFEALEGEPAVVTGQLFPKGLGY